MYSIDIKTQLSDFITCDNSDHVITLLTIMYTINEIINYVLIKIGNKFELLYFDVYWIDDNMLLYFDVY